MLGPVTVHRSLAVPGDYQPEIGRLYVLEYLEINPDSASRGRIGGELPPIVIKLQWAKVPDSSVAHTKQVPTCSSRAVVERWN
jgi:hypothetical protein